MMAVHVFSNVYLQIECMQKPDQEQCHCFQQWHQELYCTITSISIELLNHTQYLLTFSELLQHCCAPVTSGWWVEGDHRV